jgi:ATP-binding cassette subfamily B protein
MTFGGGGPSSQQANAAAGLPHAGVPGSLAQKVDEVLKAEPVHDAPVIEFTRSQFDRRPFGLRTFLAPQRLALMGAFVLVVIETIALQAGPFLTKIAIDDGIVKDDYSVVVMATIAYFSSIIISSLSTHQRIAFTGRLGEKLMYALRIRVFTHLSRQSMAFFTDEKAGVLMTRMTSDVEALSVLFQEGLVNFAVQVLTLVVIAIALFVFNVKLAIITFAAVIPPMSRMRACPSTPMASLPGA